MVSPAFVYTAAVRQIAERVTYGRQIIEQPRRTRRASEFKQKVIASDHWWGPAARGADRKCPRPTRERAPQRMSPLCRHFDRHIEMARAGVAPLNTTKHIARLGPGSLFRTLRGSL